MENETRSVGWGTQVPRQWWRNNWLYDFRCWFHYPEALWLWWPVKLKWKRHGACEVFAWHGFPLHKNCHGWTLHVGALKVVFGSVARAKRLQGENA